jgi:hypothetical protein
MTSSEYFDFAWKNLPTKSRTGLTKGEMTTRIYKPFSKLLYITSGLASFLESQGLGIEEILDKMLDILPVNGWERKLRGKLEAYEQDEKDLAKYKENT